jgi:hypothetical protein
MHGGEVENTRHELADWVQAALDEVTAGQFLVLEYLTDENLPVQPYAQAALDPGGWSCEVVSTVHLPPRLWPSDAGALTRAGWFHPDGRTQNWWRAEVGLDAAGRVLVDGLWDGLGCTDPDRYAISIGTFPLVPLGIPAHVDATTPAHTRAPSRSI